MRKNLRIFLLSLLVVIFSAASVFALSIEEAYEEEYESLASATTEGYNYRTRFVATLDGDGEAGDVVWEVKMENESDNWLKWKTDASDSKILVLEGVLPSSDNYDHGYSVVAHVSGDIDNPALEGYEGEEELPDYISGDIVSDASEISLTVESNPYTVGTFSGDLVTITPASGVYLNTMSSSYSVTVEGIYVYDDENDEEYYLATFDVDEDDILSTVSLPSWLKLQVPTPKRNSYFDDALIKYQIVYNSSVSLPRGDREAMVLVPAYPYDTSTHDSTVMIGWPVKYTAPSISLTTPSKTDISMTYGTTTTLSISYKTVKPVNVAFDTDKMNIVSWNKPTGTSGTLSIVVEPVALSGDVAAKLIVYDDNEKSADIDFNFTIAESIAVSPDVISWSAGAKHESTKTLNLLTSERPVSYNLSPEIPDGFNFTVDSDDTTITLGLNPDEAGQTYEGTLTFYSSKNNPAAVTLNIETVEAISISEDEVSISSYVISQADEYEPVDLNLENTVNPVSYTISPALPSNLNLEILSGDDSGEQIITLNFMITDGASKSYDGVLTFTDENGYSDSVNLKVAAFMSTETEKSSTSTYPGEGTQAISLSVLNPSGEVSWTTGDLPSGINAEFSSETGASTTLNVYVDEDFAEALGDYSFEVYADDEAGQRVTFEINVTVNAIPSINFGEYDSTVSIDARFSKDITVSFDTVAPVSWAFADESDTDIEGLVSFNVSWDISSTDSNAGNLTVTMTPSSELNSETEIKDENYEVILAVTDQKNQVVNLPVGIKLIIPSLILEEDSVTLSATSGGNGASKTVALLADENSEYETPVKAVNYEFPNEEPDERFNFSLTSDDSSVTFNINPTWPGLEYDGTLTIYDVFGHSSEVNLVLDSSASGDIEITSDTSDIQITAGQTLTTTLTVNNAYGTVNWIVGEIPEWLTVTPLSTTGSSATFTIVADNNASGSYSFYIEAEDEAGRKKQFIFEDNVVVPELTLSNVPSTINAVYGKTTTATFAFSGAPIVKYEFTDDISENLTVSVNYSEDVNSGNVTLSITPLTMADETYSTNLKLYDDYGHEPQAALTIGVIVPKLVIAEESTEIKPNVNGLATSSLQYSTGEYYSKPLSWDASPEIDEIFGFSVTSDDSTITLTSQPTEVNDYEGVITFYDVYSHSDSVDLVIHVVSDEPITITPEVRNLSLDAGASQELTFTANNAKDTVTWTTGTLSGVTVSPTTATGTTATFTITAGSSAVNGSLTINATDGTNTATATLNITVIAKEAAMPEKTQMDTTSEEVVTTLLNTLGLSSDDEVASLPDNIVSSEQRSASDVSGEAPSTEEIKLVFPLITPTETKVYVFAIDRAKLRGLFNNGDAIFVHMTNKNNASASGFYASESEGAKLVDDNGNEITKFNSATNINVAGLMSAGGSYSTIITSAASSKSDEEQKTTSNDVSIGSPSGTCNGGFGILAFAVLGTLLKFRKKN